MLCLIWVHNVLRDDRSLYGLKKTVGSTCFTNINRPCNEESSFSETSSSLCELQRCNVVT